MFGGYAYNLPFSAFELKARSSIPNEIAALAGKRFVTAIETNESVELNEGRIKALTGSDPITARFLYGEFFTFEPHGKYWLAFNHKPNVSDDSPGFWRRVRLVPFSQQFMGSKVDSQLLSTLKAEAPGILSWAVQGALEWQREGLKTPELVMEASREYQAESDVLRDFIDERCAVDANSKTLAARLWQEYVNWGRIRPRASPGSQNIFQKDENAWVFEGQTWSRQNMDLVRRWFEKGYSRAAPDITRRSAIKC